MSSGDKIGKGTGRKPSAATTTDTTASSAATRPRPFIPRRQPTASAPSVYSENDYDVHGNLKVLRRVPEGDQYAERSATMTLGGNGGSGELASSVRSAASRAPPAMSSPPPPQVPVSARPAANSPLYDSLPGKPDMISKPSYKHRLANNKFDVQTPRELCDREQHFVAVVRTIENRHPDEDRILQHYALQYIARQNGTYNPIDDPPVVLSDLVPTSMVIIDKIFSEDECRAESKEVSKYVKKLAALTDLDVVPVIMNKPFHVPLHPLTTFKYKDAVVDQIMREFYAAQDESCISIMDRVEADREGHDVKATKWQVYDGVSPQGAFGPKTVIKSVNDDNDTTTDDGNERALSGDEDEDEDDDEEEEKKKPADWTVVAAKKAVRAGGARQARKTNPRAKFAATSTK